jgi:ribosome-binding factor A
VLLRDGVIREQLVSKFGLNIHQVQLAKDRRTVFILWDAHAGMASACENALQHNAFRLRRDLAKLLNSKHTPFLEFRHDHLPPLKAAVAATMEQVEQELNEDAMMAEKANSAAEAAAAGFPSTAAVEAAIARLEAITAPYERQGQGVEVEDNWQDVDEFNVMDNDVAWDDLGEGIVQLHLHEHLEGEEEQQQQQQQSATWKEPEI